MHPGVYAILWYMPSDEYDNQGFVSDFSVCRSMVLQVPPMTVSVARRSLVGNRDSIRGREVEEAGRQAPLLYKAYFIANPVCPHNLRIAIKIPASQCPAV